MLRGLYKQAGSRRLPFCTEQALKYCYLQYEPTIVTDANHNLWHHSKASALSTLPSLCHHNVCLKYSRIDYGAQKRVFSPDVSNVLFASLRRTARTYASSSNVKEPRSRSNDETSQKDECLQPENREEMVGFVVDMDVSPVAKELRQAQQDMIVHMRRCSYVLFAVGAMHSVWGGVMFFALDTPLNHAVMTEVCMSSLVICGLAYQLRQTVKPIQFFTNVEEYRLTRTIFLSRQVTRMLGTFFHRGRGIAFVLLLTIGAHSLSCIRFLL